MTPTILSYKWKTDSNLEGLPTIYVHLLDFGPDNYLWVWIGDQNAKCSNLSLGLSKSDKESISSTVLNPIASDESSNKSKALAQRLSKMLRRPVFFSWSLPDMGLTEDMLSLPEMEIELFKLLKGHSTQG